MHALGDDVDVDLPSGTLAAILGAPKHSIEVEGMSTSIDVLEGVESSAGEPRYYDHIEGDN